MFQNFSESEQESENQKQEWSRSLKNVTLLSPLISAVDFETRPETWLKLRDRDFYQKSRDRD